jgi:hypothetical protein
MLSKEQLSEAINLYLKQNYSQHAIVLDGDWGVGKTYLINNIILPGIETIEYFHISLFGLSTISDIENEIYKSFLITTNTKNSYFSDKEYFSGDLLKGARLGGVGYVVQFILKKYRDLDNQSFKLVLCIDDLERWVGDLNVCLSYINKLVEHENIKCIILGNLNALDESGIQHLVKAREKTIRHIYKFENTSVSRIEIAMGLIDYRNNSCKEFINSLIYSNIDPLLNFLNKANEKNIRTISEAIQLYEYIFCRHENEFQISRRLSFTYFLTLLSALILLKKHFIHEKERATLFSGDYRENNGFSLLNKIGYFDKKSPVYLTEKSKLLLDTIFYRVDEISLKGIFSIIENGFYIEKDFEGNFSSWTDEKFYEHYLDAFNFNQLGEEEAIELLNKIISTILDEKTITNPATLLLLSERVLNDIEKGVIDLDADDVTRKIKAVIQGLYKEKKMDVMDLGYLNLHSGRYPKSKTIFKLTLKLNSSYVEDFKSQLRKSFWDKVKLMPYEIDKLFQNISDCSFLLDVNSAEEVLDSLESLSNAQLYFFSRELADIRKTLGQGEFNSSDELFLKNIIEIIYNKYEFKYGMRASNMKEIVSTLSSF